MKKYQIHKFNVHKVTRPLYYPGETYKYWWELGVEIWINGRIKCYSLGFEPVHKPYPGRMEDLFRIIEARLKLQLEREAA